MPAKVKKNISSLILAKSSTKGRSDQSGGAKHSPVRQAFSCSVVMTCSGLMILEKEGEDISCHGKGFLDGCSDSWPLFAYLFFLHVAFLIKDASAMRQKQKA